jgi:hypothetical protein
LNSKNNATTDHRPQNVDDDDNTRKTVTTTNKYNKVDKESCNNVVANGEQNNDLILCEEFATITIRKWFDCMSHSGRAFVVDEVAVDK